MLQFNLNRKFDFMIIDVFCWRCLSTIENGEIDS